MDFLLKEDGDQLLQENGDGLLLDVFDAPPPGGVSGVAGMHALTGGLSDKG